MNYARRVLARFASTPSYRPSFERMLLRPEMEKSIDLLLVATPELLYDSKICPAIFATWMFLQLHAPYSDVIKTRLNDAFNSAGAEVVASIRSRIRGDRALTFLADLLDDATGAAATSGPGAAEAGTRAEAGIGPIEVLKRSQSAMSSHEIAFFAHCLRQNAKNHVDVVADIVRSGILRELRHRPDVDAIQEPIFQLEVACVNELCQLNPEISYLSPDRALLLRRLKSQLGPKCQEI